jgi:hypothetical protein
MSDSIPTIVFNGGGKLSPNPADLKLHASLTTPESEDWILVPNKNRILITVMREQRLRSGHLVTWFKGGWCHRATMLRLFGNLPEKHELGVVSVYVTTDAEAAQTPSLLLELSDLGKRKSFNVLSMVLSGADTKQCIRCLYPLSSNAQAFENASFALLTLN